jgi:hypothetical protein
MSTEKTLKLSASLKARWVKALRSGKFKQVKGTLKNELDDGTVGYCCLGVLCAISKPVRAKVDDWENNTLLDDRETFDVVLPAEVQNYLAEKNDTGKSFKQIASYIERAKNI